MEIAPSVPIQFCLAVLSLAVSPVGLLAADKGVGMASPKSQPVQETILFDRGNAQGFFSESFEDANLAERNWYDGSQFRIVGGARAGNGCIEYEWTHGQSKVQGSSGVRHLFAPTDEVALRFYLKLSKGWGWSGRDYHPHLTHFLTTENSKWHGPAASHLTLYVEPVGGKLRLAAQDIQNAGTPHGLTQGPLKGGYNGRFYDSKELLFKDDGWHCVEAYFKLNTLDLAGNRPNRDGIVRGWFDGKLVVDHTDVVLRSTDFPKMKFNQFLLAPYFGPGLLPHAQKLWIDELAVGPKRIGLLPAGKASLPASERTQADAVPAARSPESPGKWWLKPNLRIATYEFLERGHLGRDLSVDKIMAWIHSICRLAKLPLRKQTDAIAGITKPKPDEK